MTWAVSLSFEAIHTLSNSALLVSIDIISFAFFSFAVAGNFNTKKPHPTPGTSWKIVSNDSMFLSLSIIPASEPD